ncbi:OmpA family protein [Geomonas sp. Red32]|uniref:OmpA family protein n=1 Tax=Geomonas sp. Red32 TaxID=2912856 RepID=UPI00202CC89B|nr:OmpA family protein [Geomonas sp. Red32]MCM0082535.1 OmpA family protein [Geomonas sp. Red32]
MNSICKSTICFLALGVSALAGCAKEQAVKADQAIAPAIQAPAQSPAAKPAPQASTQPGDATSINGGQLREGTAQNQPVDNGQGGTANGGSAAAGTGAVKAALEKIYFDFDSSSLTGPARGSLTKDAELIKQAAGRKVRIEGNCDEMGSDDYNLALGDRRAKEAKKYLVALGIPSDTVSTVSYGKEKPAVAGHDEAARAKNRRDEILFTAN